MDRDGAILGTASFGAPASTGDAEGKGGVQGGPVYAGLAAGDDFLNDLPTSLSRISLAIGLSRSHLSSLGSSSVSNKSHDLETLP